jgi:hypothetical protein
MTSDWEEEGEQGDEDQPDNGNVAVQMLLEDDDSQLTPEHQEISRAIRGCNFEQLRQIDEEGEGGEGDDADDDDEEEDGSEDEPVLNNLEMFLESKSMVTLSHHLNKKRRSDGSESKIWQFMKKVEMRAGINKAELEDLDGMAHGKLIKAEEKGEYYLCCVPCYNDPQVALTDCMVKPTFKKGSIDGTGNMLKHMTRKHADLWDEASRSHSYVYQGTPVTATTSDSVSDLAPGPSEKTQTPPPFKNVLYNKAKQIGDQQVLERFHNLILQFGINNDIPERVLTDHKNCPEFKNLLNYAFEHSNQLYGNKNLIPGSHKFQTLRKSRFESLVAAVSWRVDLTRQHWAQLVGHKIPFIILCQDIWDSKKKEVLGVTIMFFDPVAGFYERIPIGLELVGSKKSQDLSEQILDILKAFGIKQADLYKSANDTTNASVKVGFLLTGEQGTCAMHTTSLLIGHATGILTRSSAGTVIDSFDDLRDLFKEVMDAASWLNNKKAKSRYIKYVKLMVRLGRKGRKIVVPNATRVAGIVHHLRSLLMERWNLLEYYREVSDTKEISDNQFWLAAQVHSVLHPLSVLCDQVQTDTFGAISYTYYFIMRLFSMYYYKKYYWVVETRTSNNPDKETRWGGEKLTYPKLNWEFCPNDWENQKQNIIKGDLKGNLSRLGMVLIPRENLDPIAQTLIMRVKKEFVNYGVVPTSDRLVAFACNPFAASVLIHEFATYDAFLEEARVPETDPARVVLQDFEEKTKRALKEAIEELWGEGLNKFRDPDSYPTEDSSEEETLPYAHAHDQVKAMRRKLSKKHKRSATANTEDDPVSECIDEYFDQKFQVHVVLNSQTNHRVINAAATIGNTPDYWLDNMEFIRKNLDLAEWWKETGKTRFPMIYPVAMCILSLPDSNGHQERTFSAATWMDGKLNSMQKDLTFQMKVLMYKNANFLERYGNTMEAELLEDAEKRTRDLLVKHISSKNEEDIEYDTDRIMNLYGIYGEDE